MYIRHCADVRYQYTADYYWSFDPVTDQQRCTYNASWGDISEGTVLQGKCAALNTGKRSRGFFNLPPGPYSFNASGVGASGSSVYLDGSAASCLEVGNFSVGEHGCLVDPDQCRSGFTVGFWVIVNETFYTTKKKQALISTGRVI